MKRLTVATESGYSVPDCDEAIARLAAYENLHERIENDQACIPAQLEELRAAGKEKTVTYRELIVRKLQNIYVLDLLDEL